MQEFLELVRLAGSCLDGSHHYQTHQDGDDTSFPLNYTIVGHCILGSWLPQTHSLSEGGNHVKLYIRRLKNVAPHIDGYCILGSILMTIQEWLNSDNIDNKSRKGYAHFDCRTGIKEQRGYITPE